MTMRDDLQSGKCSKMLKALADADRLKIVSCLQDGAKDVSQISLALGGKLANISHHLKVLRQVGIVRGSRQGRHVLYSLDPDVFQSGRAGKVLDLECCKLQLVELKPGRRSARVPGA